MDQDDAFALIDRVDREEHYLWKLLQRLKQHFDNCHPDAVTGKVLCFYTIINGEIVMAGQNLITGTAYTAPVVFLNAAGLPAIGPATPTWALDVPANGTITASADGQSVNVTLTVDGTVNPTYTGTNPDGTVVTVAPFSLTAAAAVNDAVTGTVGTFAPGTTA